MQDPEPRSFDKAVNLRDDRDDNNLTDKKFHRLWENPKIFPRLFWPRESS